MDGNWSQSRLMRALGDWSGFHSDSLFRHLADRLRVQIQAGQIPAGVRLPSERALATALGVSRSTVVAALDELKAEGLIVSRQGSGTRVTRAGIHGRAQGDGRLNTFLPEATSVDQIDLRSAALPGLAMVADEVAALDRASVAGLIQSHGYVPGGLLELREAIAAYFDDLGLTTSPDQIVVTSGAQQALRLLVPALLEPGSPVLAEEPTFRGAIETLRAESVRITPVPSHSNGIDLVALESAIRVSRARILFVQASGNNPTGATMDADSRKVLVELAARHNVVIVEDAAVADASMMETILPPLAAYGDGRGITIGSASKSFWGGLRVGWLRVDAGLAENLTVMKGAEDLGTSLVAQLVTARLLSQIDTARRLRRAGLSAARDFVLDTIDDVLPDWEYTRPLGGASLWVRIPHGSATALTQQAARHGVSVLPGPTFSSLDGLDDHLRIGLAAPIPVLGEGLSRLADAWKKYTPSPEREVAS